MAERHPVRVVNRIMDSIRIEPLVRQYEGGGTWSYPPRMLLKAMVFTYLSKIFSSRKMEEALSAKHLFHVAARDEHARPQHDQPVP